MDTEFDIEVKDAFLTICAGNEKEAKEAFAWLYYETWEEVLGVLKSRSDIIAVDITDIKRTSVNYAYQTLWEMARSGKIKDIDKDPRALLHTLALRKAIDEQRSLSARKRKPDPESWDDYVNQRVEESSISALWKMLEIRGLATEVMDDFRSWMRQQPKVCRRTAFAMAEFLPDLIGASELHEYLCRTTDPPPTYESVKKARKDVLERFKTSISKKYEGMWK